MKKVLVLFIISVLFVSAAYAHKVYVEDNDVLIPIETHRGDFKSIQNSDNTITTIDDQGSFVEINHPDGTITVIEDK